MVLINKLTIDEINAALLHIQRSRTEVVGGTKGNTVQNITIQNNGGSGSSAPDFTNTIAIIQNRLEQLGLKDEDLQSQINGILGALGQLEENHVVNLRFEEQTRELFLDFENGDFLSVVIPTDQVELSLDTETNELTLRLGTQTKSIILPYINSSEKGVAGGVATLDSSGRVPYSQLPESAMEFKGEWDASTNTPTLADGTGVNGDFYIVAVGGTVNFGTQAEPREVTFYPNDRVIYNGSSELWTRLPAGSVVSVNGMSGAVVLDADDIMYDSTQTVKEKIDDTAQSDWTEQNSSSPSFIKHKIPIWITGTGADDNVTPIDSVTLGSMRPVTSNAVAQALSWKLIGEKTGFNKNIPFNPSNYNEVMFIANIVPSEGVYITSQIIPTSYLANNRTFSMGYGGRLNTSTPYGFRATVKYDNNNITLTQAVYDNADISGTKLTVYAR